MSVQLWQNSCNKNNVQIPMRECNVKRMKDQVIANASQLQGYFR